MAQETNARPFERVHFIGIGGAGMSGIALVNQIQFMLQMLINGAGEGLIVMASRYWGERNPDSIHKTISVGMWMGLAFSVLLWALVFFFPMPVLRLLTPE